MFRRIIVVHVETFPPLPWLHPTWEHTRRQALEIVPCSKPSARSSMICFLLAFVAIFPYAKSRNKHLRVTLFPPYKKGVSGEKFGLLGWFVCSMYLATLNAPVSSLYYKVIEQNSLPIPHSIEREGRTSGNTAEILGKRQRADTHFCSSSPCTSGTTAWQDYADQLQRSGS